MEPFRVAPVKGKPKKDFFHVWIIIAFHLYYCSMNTKEMRNKLYSLLGDLPDRDRPVEIEVIDTIGPMGPGRPIVSGSGGPYLLKKLRLDLNGTEPVPAYLTLPAGDPLDRESAGQKNSSGPYPVVIYNHAHGGNYELGKDELLYGRPSLQTPPYAQVLAEQGYAALCIDTWAFGERRGRTESSIFKEMLWKGRVMWGMMVFDTLKVIDGIELIPELDETRIGTLGLSMGSTMAWWTAALDERIKCCIDICCLTDYHDLIEQGGLDGHGIYYYVPNILKHFSTSTINELIAPRPHLSLAGLYDPLTPANGLEKIDTHCKAVYKNHEAEDAWKLITYHTGHFETAHMRREILTFLDKWL